MNQIERATACAVLLIVAAACSSAVPVSTPVVAPTQTPAANAEALTTVRSGVIGGLMESGQYLAQSEGYFTQEGVANDFVKTDPANLFSAMLAGGVDVFGGPIDPGMMNAIQRGIGFKIVATQGSNEPGSNGTFLVVRKDLIDSGRVAGYADLRGLKVAIPAPGDAYVIGKALQLGGLTLDDVDLEVLNFPAAVAALGTGGVDVAVVAEPLASVAVRNGSGVKWKGYADVLPGIQTTVVVFSPQFAAQRDLAVRWMTGYIRGIRDFNDAFVKNINRPRVVRTLASALSIEPQAFDDIELPYIDPDGKVNVASIEDRMQWYVQSGDLSAPVDLSETIDLSFAEAAVARLGAYR